MPLFYQQDINQDTRLAVWEICEAESFFLEKVSLKKEITHPQKRLQHLAGRYLLGYLFPDFPAELIEIADTRKPFLPDEQYHFSISHCGNFAAAIVSRSERVGIDVELLTPRVEKIKHKFLHPEELQMVDHTAIDRVQLLTLLWSAKEAMFKWWGNGDVDFSEVLRIYELPDKSEGTLKTSFVKKQNYPLILHYQLFSNLTLVWTKGNIEYEI
ncbi:MAG: 4'-phosphopantetheinyl transferase superfamily protein [Sediminibacterium sp. Gen4]|uniref:4'-phosphopantetheinyl transferase family protein n=1 Tax=unclassified Sediminibacterium TaxID=2635961 RepID=UPI0015BDC178|nr:4'-phosphopantetheinyl transferase superfamily protein [Sediminibacterium sp.]MBW0160963.1 4'-phosphopantetheinyl transferase superfamily protein [Sediminibacterium sp.]MBW0164558.1 4'-phosphopantetheinyl transferase superfamily protein [Sediminibacterium sp.]NWK64996.1 4'-phosphopantetheinyl transferase superfamily protein [Sediminibacterium sp. Gen4]